MENNNKLKKYVKPLMTAFKLNVCCLTASGDAENDIQDFFTIE